MWLPPEFAVAGTQAPDESVRIEIAKATDPEDSSIRLLSFG